MEKVSYFFFFFGGFKKRCFMSLLPTKERSKIKLETKENGKRRKKEKYTREMKTEFRQISDLVYFLIILIAKFCLDHSFKVFCVCVGIERGGGWGVIWKIKTFFLFKNRTVRLLVIVRSVFN